MALGLSATNFADVAINYFLKATAGTVPAANYVQLHTDVGEPGAVGTANVCTGAVGALRVVITYGAISTVSTTRSITSSGTAPSWVTWDGGPVNIKYISVWSAVTAGNFLFSAQLTATKAITNGDTFTLSSLTFALGTVAA
jgi:hypothetical protein